MFTEGAVDFDVVEESVDGNEDFDICLGGIDGSGNVAMKEGDDVVAVDSAVGGVTECKLDEGDWLSEV
jgi:hypothetical protein